MIHKVGASDKDACPALGVESFCRRAEGDSRGHILFTDHAYLMGIDVSDPKCGLSGPEDVRDKAFDIPR